MYVEIQFDTEKPEDLNALQAIFGGGAKLPPGLQIASGPDVSPPTITVWAPESTQALAKATVPLAESAGPVETRDTSAPAPAKEKKPPKAKEPKPEPAPAAAAAPPPAEPVTDNDLEALKRTARALALQLSNAPGHSIDTVKEVVLAATGKTIKELTADKELLPVAIEALQKTIAGLGA